MESPPYWYVRDTVSRAAHHWDYLRDNRFRSLCGHRYTGEIKWHGGTRPRRVCRACQHRLPIFEATWWQAQATAQHENAATADRERAIYRYQLSLAEKKIRELQTQIERMQHQGQNRSVSTAIIEQLRVDNAALRAKSERQRTQLAKVQRALERKNHRSSH